MSYDWGHYWVFCGKDFRGWCLFFSSLAFLSVSEYFLKLFEGCTLLSNLKISSSLQTRQGWLQIFEAIRHEKLIQDAGDDDFGECQLSIISVVQWGSCHLVNVSSRLQRYVHHQTLACQLLFFRSWHCLLRI